MHTGHLTNHCPAADGERGTRRRRRYDVPLNELRVAAILGQMLSPDPTRPDATENIVIRFARNQWCQSRFKSAAPLNRVPRLTWWSFNRSKPGQVIPTHS